MHADLTSADRVSALNALYQSERADSSAMQAINAAIVGLAVAYAGGTAAFLNQDTLKSTSAWTVALLPAPLWIISLFLGMLSATQARRSMSVIALERRLTHVAGLTAGEKNAVGLRGVRSVTDFRRAGHFSRLSLLVSFSGEVLLTIGYTVLMLSQAAAKEPASIAWILPLAGYGLLSLLIAATWFINERERGRLAERLLDIG